MNEFDKLFLNAFNCFNISYKYVNFFFGIGAEETNCFWDTVLWVNDDTCAHIYIYYTRTRSHTRTHLYAEIRKAFRLTEKFSTTYGVLKKLYFWKNEIEKQRKSNSNWTGFRRSNLFQRLQKKRLSGIHYIFVNDFSFKYHNMEFFSHHFFRYDNAFEIFWTIWKFYRKHQMSNIK